MTSIFIFDPSLSSILTAFANSFLPHLFRQPLLHPFPGSGGGHGGFLPGRGAGPGETPGPERPMGPRRRRRAVVTDFDLSPNLEDICGRRGKPLPGAFRRVLRRLLPRRGRRDRRGRRSTIDPGAASCDVPAPSPSAPGTHSFSGREEERLCRRLRTSASYSVVRRGSSCFIMSAKRDSQLHCWYYS